MRIFLAVHAGEQLARELSARLDPWRDRLPVRWTRPAAWHLTLQFLDDWPLEALERLQARLTAMDPGPPFTLRPAGLGGFPDLRGPRVLFLQMDDDGKGGELVARVRKQVDMAWPEGPQDRRPYRGHLTMARVRGSLDEEHLKMIEDMDMAGLADVPVEGFSLVASQLGKDGPRYRDLAFWRLRKKGE